MSIWLNMMNEFPDGEDDVIEDLIFEAMFLNDDDEESQSKSFPMKSDGSGMRAVNRDDYSRGPKEPKLNLDPRFIYYSYV